MGLGEHRERSAQTVACQVGQMQRRDIGSAANDLGDAVEVASVRREGVR